MSMIFSFFKGDWEEEQTITLSRNNTTDEMVRIKVLKRGIMAPADGKARVFELPTAFLERYIRQLFTTVYYDGEFKMVQIDTFFMPSVMFTIDKVVNPKGPCHLRDAIADLLEVFTSLRFDSA